MKATVGRIVHFRGYADAQCEAAIVAAVPNDDSEAVGLVIFRASLDEVSGIEVANHVEHVETLGRGWHWPEREGPAPS